LHEHNLVKFHGTEEASLVPKLMLTGVALSGGALAAEQRTDKTIYGIRRGLIAKKWCFAKTTRTASVLNKQFCKHQCKTYFELIWDHGDILANYESEDLFSHSQTNGYYVCLEIAVQSNPEVGCAEQNQVLNLL
jgi:hypothetical protein